RVWPSESALVRIDLDRYNGGRTKRGIEEHNEHASAYETKWNGRQWNALASHQLECAQWKLSTGKQCQQCDLCETVLYTVVANYVTLRFFNYQTLTVPSVNQILKFFLSLVTSKLTIGLK